MGREAASSPQALFRSEPLRFPDYCNRGDTVHEVGKNRCRNIELVLSDVDGVLTDGGITFDNQGIETKEFYHP